MVTICSICSGNKVHTHYLQSFVQEISQEMKPECGLSFIHAPASDISRGRDQLAAIALADPTCSHILWIDADEGWLPGLTKRLLSHDKDIVGATYRKKGDRVAWTHQPLDGARLEGDLIQCSGIGTGAMLVKRQVFEKMADALPELWIDPDKIEFQSNACSAEDFKRHFKGYHLQMIHEGSVHSDDYAFCRRAIQCGFEVWADLGWPIYHYGEKCYYGNAIESPEALSRQ